MRHLSNVFDRPVRQLKKSERRILWLAWSGFGAFVSYFVFSISFVLMIANLVPNSSAAVYALILSLGVCAAWLGTLRAFVEFPT